MPELINKFKCQYHSKSSYDEAYDEVVRMRNPLPLPIVSALHKNCLKN